MSTRKRRVFPREVKLSAVERLAAGEAPRQIAQELEIGPSHLSKWWANYRRYGAEGLRPAHRPLKSEAAKLKPMATTAEAAAAQQRICELERKIGQQQLELDFFQKALRRVGQARRPSDGSGLQTSMLRSRQ
jgi:transposase-like protein